MDDGATDLAILDGEVARVRARLAAMPEDHRGYGPLVRVLAELLERRARLRAPEPGQDDDERDARAAAERVIERIEEHVREAEARLAAASGGRW